MDLNALMIMFIVILVLFLIFVLIVYLVMLMREREKLKQENHSLQERIASLEEKESIAPRIEAVQETPVTIAVDESLELPASPVGNVQSVEPDHVDADQNLMLIVEDSDEAREILTVRFSPAFRILEASNGREGLALALKYVPDIVVSDVMMPEMDGNAFCRALKSSMATCHIPVILLTARTSTLDKKEGYDVGADSYVTKPFSPHLLESRIKNLLKSRAQLRTHYTHAFMVTSPESPARSADEIFMKQLVQVIEKYSGEPDFDVNKLALEFSFSRAVLYRKVKGLTNMSLVEIIRTVRLNKAAKLLNTRQYRVSEVAFMVGFNDLKHFRHCFKEQFHVSPSELLKGDAEGKAD